MTNWRNFQAAKVRLQLRAFFVGPNASGKSNFLDAIRFLAEIARPGSGGLQAAISSRGGFSSLRCLQARSKPHIEIVASVGTTDAPRAWRYTLRINVLKGEKFATVINEIIEKDGQELRNWGRGNSSDALEFSQTLLEQVQQNKEFRELGEFLGSCRYLHVVPQIVRDRARARSEGEDPFGGDLLRRIKEMPKRNRDARLGRIGEALKIAVPQFNEIELDVDSEGIPHLQASYVHWRPHATKQSELAFSDGTLRLIGLLWSISEKGGPLLLEEPELSLNDAVVGELPEMFATMQRLSGRQIIATTHSASLLSDIKIGLKEVHRIVVTPQGSCIETLNDNQSIDAQVNEGMNIAQAVLPLLSPEGVERLGRLDVSR